ncbi:Pes4p [Nakaseomyces bracarensis]|uniref:Pes4p n=1 Tax=Nakaseomyces bracarensis TaxID=273131 RepID=UPI0038726891
MKSSNVLRQISLNKRPKNASNEKENFSTGQRHVSIISSRSASPDVVQINNESFTLGTSDSVSTALFIGNLDPHVTTEMLSEIFQKYPSFISAKVCIDSESQKSLGHGYLNFGSKEEADIATDEHNYQVVFGREIRIMPSLRDSIFRKNIGTNVFFSNLPLQREKLTSRRFYNIFRQFGKILSVKLDSNKNIGFVYFEDEKVAKDVIKQFNRKEFLGNVVSCGIHFDKDIRKDPQFEKKLSILDTSILVEKEIDIPTTENVELQGAIKKNALIQPYGIFVKNLSINVTKNDVLDNFSEAGPIKSVFLSTRNNSDYLWAFITFKNKESVSKAIQKFNGRELRGKKLFVTYAYSKENIPSKGLLLQLSNLSPICNKRFLIQAMEQLKIIDADIVIRESENKEFLTMTGEITFKNKRDLLTAQSFLHQKIVGGCEIQAIQEGLQNKVKKEIIPNPISENFAPKKGRISVQSNVSNPFLGKYVVRSSTPFTKENKNYYIPRNRYVVSPNTISNTYSKHNQQEDFTTITEVLNMNVKKQLDNLKFPFASRPENLNTISDYIFTVYWNRDKSKVSEFLLLLGTSPKYGRIFVAQVDSAATTLGFGR